MKNNRNETNLAAIRNRSFCDKVGRRVETLIAGLGDYIRNESAESCSEIIEERSQGRQ